MLYLMRHGRTDWNERRKLQGSTDIPLNETGRRMAAEAAVQYAGVSIDVCYCSPLLRARKTAELVLKDRCIPILPDVRLREMGFGSYEGVENSFQIPDCPVNVLFFHPEQYLPVEGGESLEELFARTGEFLREVVIPQLAEGKNILIVGHGVMNAALICQGKGLTMEHLWDAGVEQCKLMPLELKKLGEKN